MSVSGREAVTPFNVDKYLVLLHDCLAIKFVPLVSSLSYNSNKTKINSSATNNNGVHNNNMRDEFCEGISSIIKDIKPNVHKCSSHPSQCSLNPCQNGQAAFRPYFQAHTTTASPRSTKKNTCAPNVDHSVHGLFLYKEFVQVNLQCFWNDAVFETFNNLEYKGYVVPSTILVTSSSSRYLNVLKTAWSRKMVHSVPGYRIEFIGEIEEMIADPIQKSHFVPLADTLCWAIYEITSSGREAFADGILTEISRTFATMVQPSRKLVYETLEKLTRAKKVYQTATGYFVVTPDTHRYIISCDESSLLSKAVDTCAAPSIKHDEGLQHKTTQGNVFLSSNDNSEGKKSLLQPQNSDVKECNDKNNDCSRFKRSNSLRCFPRKEQSSGTFSRSRNLSLRMPRNKKRDDAIEAEGKLEKDMKNLKVTDDTNGNGRHVKSSRSSKGTSFLSRLLTFRRSKAKVKKISCTNKSQAPNKMFNTKGKQLKSRNVLKETQTMSTQTSFSIENVSEVPKVNPVVVTNVIGSNSNSTAEDSDSGRYTESSSDAEITAALAGFPLLPVKTKEHAQARKDELGTPGWSISDPVYEKLRSQSSCSQFSLTHEDMAGDNSSEHHNKNNNSDCESTTMAKDYCKSSNSSSSPCPSTTISDRSTSSLSSYRELYNFYRRRHPTYKGQPCSSSSSPSAAQQAMRKPNNVVSTASLPPRPKVHEARHSFRKVCPPKKSTTTLGNTTPGYKIDSKCETNGSNSASSTTTTTTVTQTVKSDSNVELELLLPLEKLINAALNAQREKAQGKDSGSSGSGINKSQKIDSDKGNDYSSGSSGSRGLQTEFVTNVSDLFSIKSHVSISPDDAMSSTIEIKTKSLPKMESISVKPSEFKEDCRESEII